MGFWMIVGWMGVAIMTGANIFVFFKLKSTAEQMLKSAFPNSKSMTEAMQQMQKMMGAFQSKSPFGGGVGGPNAQKDQNLKQALEMLQNLKQSPRK